MTSGFGVDRAADGLSGTSAQDIRKIFGGLYSAGVISGAKITTSPSAMSYSVSAGVVAISTATGEVVMAPVPAGTVPTTAPGSGSRTDIIYAQQRFPSVEGDADLVLGVGTVLPSRAVKLDSYIVSAGQTNTNSAVRTGSVDFSIPYGASLGTLYEQRYTGNGYISVATPGATILTGTITVPTDRRIRVTVNACMSATRSTSGPTAVRFDDLAYTEAGFMFKLNGSTQWIWNTPGLHQAWANYSWNDYLNVTAGTHTVSLNAFRVVGPGLPYFRYTGGEYRGTLFTVEDAGPVV